MSDETNEAVSERSERTGERGGVALPAYLDAAKLPPPFAGSLLQRVRARGLHEGTATGQLGAIVADAVHYVGRPQSTVLVVHGEHDVEVTAVRGDLVELVNAMGEPIGSPMTRPWPAPWEGEELTINARAIYNVERTRTDLEMREEIERRRRPLFVSENGGPARRATRVEELDQIASLVAAGVSLDELKAAAAVHASKGELERALRKGQLIHEYARSRVELRPLDVIETRSIDDMLRDGDANGARVIRTTGERGTVSVTVMRDPMNRVRGWTPLLVELDGYAPVPCRADELRPITRVKYKATGLHGIVFLELGELRFVPDGRRVDQAVPIKREEVEAIGPPPAPLVAAALALQKAGETFDEVQRRLDSLVHGIHDGAHAAEVRAHIQDVVVTLGDASCACSVAARNARHAEDAK